MQIHSLLEPVSAIARKAGADILQIYLNEDFGVVNKTDASPLTRADMAAHHIIVDGLQALTPNIPVLSEESAAVAWEQRRLWSAYWLVDPLDGTKEFIKRNGEFTVNIALIEHGIPILGVVYAPVLDWLYSGVQGHGASKETAEHRQPIRIKPVNKDQQLLRVVASRTHGGAELDAWMQKTRQRFEQVETLSMGSSLKICLVAEGAADIYPRLSPTSEWDTAAAQGVLEAAGGMLLDDNWQPCRYNGKESLLNPHFYATGTRDLDLR